MSEASVTDESPMLRGALDLLELSGALLVPSHHLRADGQCSCGRGDCASPGKHPRGDGWQLRATSDPHEVRSIWTRWPDAGVGIATGISSGIVVLDVDGAEGEASLAALEEKYGPLPPAPTVITSRGRHLYFAAGSIPLHNRQGARGRGLGKGLDLRAEGGFVMAPPSRHPSGISYAWAHGLSIGELPPATLPAWIVEAARERPQQPSAQVEMSRQVPQSRAEKWADGALLRECQNVRNAPEGQRNNTLNTAAFNLGMIIAGGAIDGGAVRRALHQTALEAGLSEFEAMKTIQSGIAAGMRKDQRGAPSRDLPRADVTRAPDGDDTYEPPGPDDNVVQLPVSAMQPRHNTASLFSALPAQRWVVPGLQLGPGRPTLIAGYGASAKTISVQALALAVASGRPIWGHFESSPMVVLHIDYEQGYYATAKRYQRLALGMGIDPRELENRLHYIELPRVYLDKKGGEEEFLRACDGVDLVIIDALRGAAPHTDENDSAFRSAIDSLTFCSQRTGASYIVLHHAAKPRKESSGDARTVARGTSAIYDASGCVMNIVAKPGEEAKLVTQVKMPAEAEGQPLEPFELVVEDVLVDGNATAGARVVWRRPVPVDISAQAEQQFERDAALIIRAVGRAPGGQSNQITAKCGLGKQRALEVLRALAEEGRLIVTAGKNRAKYYSLPVGDVGEP